MLRPFLALIALALLAQTASAATLVRDVSITAPNAASLESTVDKFRDDLGSLNDNLPENLDPNGRRQIDWDAAPDGVSDPNAFPGDFFNFNADPRARGIEFRETGSTTGFLLSSTQASGQPVEFGFDASFTPFSEERLFAPVGGTTFDVLFFDPADQVTPGATRGLGVIFTGVDVQGGSEISFFGLNGEELAKRDVPISDEVAALSFVGLIFDQPVISRVSIKAGDRALLANGNFGAGADGVVLDDFIFGEPVNAVSPIPLPGGLGLLATALLGFAAWRRRG
ncbi:MAG: hypothetical protein AAGI13_06925 [Pseudomonadota bacterium]